MGGGPNSRLMTGQQGRLMTGQQARLGTASGGGSNDLARPMTSVSGAGYSKQGPAKSFDPLNQRGAAPALAEKADNSPEDLAREMVCMLTNLYL